ncbi:MAG: hypothetical protein ACM3ZA_12690 [Bacillota bacterium]
MAATAEPPLPSPPQVIQVSPRAWSGWWWPMYDGPGTGPHLYDPGGPLAKYDALVVSQGRPNPGTLSWSLANMRTSDPKNTWWGHCNGWAVAAILEPEPTKPREVGGIAFSVADQKGLLSSWYQGVGVKFQLGGPEGLSALLFHRAVQDWVVERGTPIIINAYNVQGNEYQVWNYPLVQARLAYTPDAAQPGVTHVAATVWLASDAVPADFVGTTLWPGEQGITYTYRLTGDVSRPTGAGWEGPSAGPGTLDRPSLVWYPDPTWRYIPPLTPPGMDYATLRLITGHPSGATAAAAASAAAAPSAVAPAAMAFAVAPPVAVSSSATARPWAARALP